MHVRLVRPGPVSSGTATVDGCPRHADLPVESCCASRMRSEDAGGPKRARRGRPCPGARGKVLCVSGEAACTREKRERCSRDEDAETAAMHARWCDSIHTRYGTVPAGHGVVPPQYGPGEPRNGPGGKTAGMQARGGADGQLAIPRRFVMLYFASSAGEAHNGA